MRYRKLIVYFFTALLLAVAVFFGAYESRWHGEMTLTVLVTSDGQEEEITCWQQEGKNYYLFLPGYGELADMKLHTNTNNTVRLNGQILADGTSCEDLTLDTPCELTYEHEGEDYPFTVTFLRSSGVATMYLDVASGSMDNIHASRENEEPGTLRVYTADGQLDYKGNLESLKGRGSSTWVLSKKPYNLTLSTAGDLLGMGSATRWILLANANDSSNLRNKMVYDFAQAMELSYSPECRWVDLYLNGEYAGLYLLTERNEVHTQRVDLQGEGSFLVSKDWAWRMEEKAQPYITTESLAALRIHSSDISEEELTQVWQSVENAILAEDGIDPMTGRHWTELIDLDSWAKKFLIEEVFANTDAGTLSQFFYRDGSGKIYAGPVWDYDLTLSDTAQPNMFYAYREYIYGSEWYAALYEKEEFYNRVTELYETLCRPLAQTLLDSGIEKYTEETARSSQLNRIRWGIADAAEAAETLSDSFSKRLAFLDSIWIDGKDYISVYVLGYDGGVSHYALEPGDTLPALPECESNDTTAFYGWYYEDTQQPFDPDAPIWEDTTIYLNYENKQ